MPTGDEPISKGVLSYMSARYQTNVHSLVLEEFERSGMTSAQVARRLRMDPGQLARLLGNPSNMTLDTLSGLLFAIAGKEPDTNALKYGEMDARQNEFKEVHVSSADIIQPVIMRETKIVFLLVNAPFKTEPQEIGMYKRAIAIERGAMQFLSLGTNSFWSGPTNMIKQRYEKVEVA